MMTETTVSRENCVPRIVQVRRALVIVICLHFALLLAMGLFRHWGNMSSLNDLGVFDQAVWGTLHGQWVIDNNNFIGQPINWLGCHFNVVLLLFVPLYAIWPAAEWFVLVQALALSVTAWPIFLLASRVHCSERRGLLWAVIYLFNPFLLSAAAWDFHPVTIAVPFIAGALLAVEKKDLRLLMMCCVVLLLVQVQFGIMVASLGALWGLKHRCWRSGLLLAGLGILHTVLVLGVIVPALSPSGTHLMIIDQSGQNSRYGWLGGSLSEIVKNIAFHPVWMVQKVISLGAVKYFASLALPLLGLFLISPVWLLPAIADLAANSLSANPMPRAIISYHSVTLIPILTVSAIYGAARIAPLFAKVMSTPVPHLVLIITAASCYVLAPLPLPGALDFWKPVQWVNVPDPVLKKVRALGAGGASLSVQTNVGAHFSQNPHLYGYPYKSGESDVIVLWLDSPTSKLAPHDRHMIGTLAHHVQMKPAEYLASVERMLRDPNYGIVLWEEPWLVFSRGEKAPGSEASVRNRLDKLRGEWKITSSDCETALREFKPL